MKQGVTPQLKFEVQSVSNIDKAKEAVKLIFHKTKSYTMKQNEHKIFHQHQDYM